MITKFKLAAKRLEMQEHPMNCIELKRLVPEVEIAFLFAIENLIRQTLYINRKR